MGNWKVDDGSSIDFEWTGGNTVQQEMIEILSDDSTGWKEASNYNIYHGSRQRKVFDMSVTLMRMSFAHL